MHRDLKTTIRETNRLMTENTTKTNGTALKDTKQWLRSVAHFWRHHLSESEEDEPRSFIEVDGEVVVPHQDDELHIAIEDGGVHRKVRSIQFDSYRGGGQLGAATVFFEDKGAQPREVTSDAVVEKMLEAARDYRYLIERREEK